MRLITLLLTAALAVADLKLVRRALGGNGRAMRSLVQRIMPVIRARVRRRVGTAAHAEDLTQEIWLALLENGGRQLFGFDPSRGSSLEGYVGMIAERRIVDQVRKATAAKRGAQATFSDDVALDRAADGGANPEADAVAADLARRLAAHLEASLPGMGLLVMRLVYTDQHPPKEAARIMGVNLQVVYNWQHRIRTEVKAFLAAQ